jgi:L-alanine-DL-glutamate epimerase-like enolase superfamily enzyme
VSPTIRSVRTLCFAQPMIPIHQGHFPGALELVLTIVEADDGCAGYSLARTHGGQPGSTIAAPIEISLAPRVVGLDARQPAQAWERMITLEPAGYVSVFAISAVDVALWDLAARLQGRPVADLLGARRRALEPYASSSHHPGIDAYVDDLRHALARGYRAYKVHPFYDPVRDVELALALREAAGPGVRLMLDAAKRYDEHSSLQVGRALQRAGFHWFEEPLPQHHWAGYRRLREQLDIPVIGGETLPGLHPAIGNALDARAYDAVLCDVYWKGGITGALRTFAVCREHGVPVVSHHGASALMNLANLHLLCAHEEPVMIEMLFPEAPYECGIDRPARIGADGLVHLPDGPGLGALPDWSYIHAHAVGAAIPGPEQ